MKPGAILIGLSLLVASFTAARATDSPVIRIAAGGQLAGFEADFAHELCLRSHAHCELVREDEHQRVSALLGRRYDAVIAGLDVTPERQRVIDFTHPYAILAHGFAIHSAGPLSGLPGDGKSLSLSGTPEDAKTVMDALRRAFRGRIIGAETGSPDLRFLEAHFGDVATIRAYGSGQQRYDDLAAGRIAAVMDANVALSAVASEPDYAGLVLTGPHFSDDAILGFGIAVGVRKTDPELRDQFDRATDDMIRDGSLRQLSLKWFNADITPHRCACKPF